ncbi:MAG TPA: NAD(P)/FAD-dependent oxidoreductase [Solirubrobacteraceae bacterium]
MRTKPPEHVDVLIVGAGLSGVGAACHLQRRCPGRSFAILEMRDDLGGTWDLFRYPGIRSDSDMHTLGYSFRPWKDANTIADGPAILTYIRETAREYRVTERIHYGYRVTGASWSTPEARWTVTAEDSETAEQLSVTCSFLQICGGYYSYEHGYTPDFPGVQDFEGTFVHPQQWPEDLDYAGKRVVIIGSGATAITLVPAMAEQAAHVTMVQRSPSYVVALPRADALAKAARRVLPEMAAYQAVRWKNVALMSLSYQLSRRRPNLAKKVIRRGVKSLLPDGFDIDTHFRPDYNPWDQRLCVCPDGDFFRALRHGTASMVTGHIETLTPSGLRMQGGEEVEADIIVSATGLRAIPLGGLEFVVDGEPVTLPDRLTYKGMMIEGVPNAAMSFGYTNASWTLKCDLTCEYVCRLLNHMAQRGQDYCVPESVGATVVPEPLIGLNSGYVLRALDQFPHQGAERPWRLHQNYALDIVALRLGDLEDGAMRFGRRGEAVRAGGTPASEPQLPVVAAA